MAASVQKKDLMIRLVTTTTLLKLGTKSQNVTMSKYRSHIEYPLVIITETNAFRMTKPSPTRAKIVSSAEGG